MKKTVKFSKRNIMKNAWALVKAKAMTISQALKKAWADTKAVVLSTVEVNTWYGWKMLGREVIHGSKAMFQTIVADNTKNGTRVLSYFSFDQTCELGTQEA